MRGITQGCTVYVASRAADAVAAAAAAAVQATAAKAERELAAAREKEDRDRCDALHPDPSACAIGVMQALSRAAVEQKRRDAEAIAKGARELNELFETALALINPAAAAAAAAAAGGGGGGGGGHAAAASGGSHPDGIVLLDSIVSDLCVQVEALVQV